MKKFSRLLSGTLAILMGISLLAGCTAKNNATAPEPTSTKPKTTVRLWWRSSGIGPFDHFIEKLNTMQNEVEIQIEGFGESYGNILNVAINAGEAPEMFSPGALPIGPLADANRIVPVDDLLTPDFKANLHPAAYTNKSFLYKGKLYAIPMRLQIYKLLYNKDLFKSAGLDPNKPPQTLEEMKDYSTKITKAGNGQFYGMGIFVNYPEMWLRHIDLLSIAEGVTGLGSFDYKTGKFDFSKQKKYFDYWVQFYKEGSLFPGALTLGVEQMRANFAAGKVGMMIDGCWMSTEYANTIKTTADWDATQVPIFAGTKRAKDYMGALNTYLITNSKKIDAAKAAYKLILQNIMLQRSFGETEPKTYLPANADSAFDLLPKDVTYKAVKEMNNITNHSVFLADPRMLIKLEGDTNEKTWTNLFAAAIDGKASNIDQVLDDLSKRYNKGVDQAIVDGAITAQEAKPDNFDYYTR